MTQKTLGYVALEWTCPRCGTKNPGPQKTCTSCGSPQPQDVQFEQKQQSELITDQQIIEQAARGSDIHCPYCGTRNLADAASCVQCGGDLKGGVKRESGRVVGAFKAGQGPVRQIPCPSCSTLNPETRPNCSACGASLTAPVTPVAAVKTALANTKPKSLFLLLAVAAAILVLCIALIALRSIGRESLAGTIQSVSWSRTVAVEELRDVTLHDWRSNIPAGVSIGECKKQVHHTQAEPPKEADAVFEEVCATSYVKDTGTGLGQVVQDCEYKVSLDYCSYTGQEWQEVNQVKLEGNNLSPKWPDPSLAADQRSGDQDESFIIVFETGKGQYTYTTSDEQLFAQCLTGSEWDLKINAFNQVVSIDPK